MGTKLELAAQSWVEHRDDGVPGLPWGNRGVGRVVRYWSMAGEAEGDRGEDAAFQKCAKVGSAPRGARQFGCRNRNRASPRLAIGRGLASNPDAIWRDHVLLGSPSGSPRR
jgi:hypothetical protein